MFEMNFWLAAVLIGIGATVVMDIWGLLRRQVFGVPLTNFGLVGRWLAYMPRGRFRHSPIAATPPVTGEQWIGWTAHYLIGIFFAAVLLALFGAGWARQPTLGPALIVGIATVAAPFLLMQPGMGAGMAASRTPRPAAARLQSLVTHGIFGLGLYAAGWVTRLLVTF